MQGEGATLTVAGDKPPAIPAIAVNARGAGREGKAEIGIGDEGIVGGDSIADGLTLTDGGGISSHRQGRQPTRRHSTRHAG